MNVKQIERNGSQQLVEVRRYENRVTNTTSFSQFYLLLITAALKLAKFPVSHASNEYNYCDRPMRH